MWQVASTGEKVFMFFVLCFYAAVVVAFFVAWLNRRHRRILDAITEVKKQLERDKEERLFVRCSGLFGRLLRELRKLPDFPFDHNRISPTIMEITHRGITMSVAIDPNAAPYTMGQFIAYNLPMGAGHGCENTLESFARGIKDNMFGWVLGHPDLIEEYHRRKAYSERCAAVEAARKAEAEKPKPPKWWQKDVLHILRTRTA